MISSWPGECKMIFNRPRHPQSNGLVEQANGTIENHIAAGMEQFNTKEWTKILPYLYFYIKFFKFYIIFFTQFNKNFVNM